MTTVKKVKFWSRITRDGSQEWVLVEGRDPSRVPIKAWKELNRAFNEWRLSGLLWPLDELDAYQIACREMIRVAGNLPPLSRASRATYLVATAYRTLWKHRERMVQPTRDEYTATTNRAQVRTVHDHDAVSVGGEDRTDREWSSPTDTTFNVRAFVESLSGTHSYNRQHAADIAERCVHSTLERVDADTRRGLLAWLDADGIWRDAAYRCPLSPQAYAYRFHHVWAPAFRRACYWKW